MDEKNKQPRTFAETQRGMHTEHKNYFDIEKLYCGEDKQPHCKTNVFVSSWESKSLPRWLRPFQVEAADVCKLSDGCKKRRV